MASGRQGMHRRVGILTAIVVALVLAERSAPAAERGRPNVVLVLTDDQGYGDLSCHGNPILKTPNLDRLHSQSIRLTDFHVAPMCSPTRGQLLTGQDALRNGATFVCMGRAPVREEIPSMADVFAVGGYKTAHFGKWHLGDNYPFRPQDRGFQETVHHPSWGITSLADYLGNDYADDHFRHNGRIEQYRGYCTDVWFDEAMKWMRGRAAAGEPFLVYLPTNAPHWPRWVPDKYRQPYIGKVPADVAAFYGMIANIDENIGRLTAMLDETGQADNTILIFATDNGATAGAKIFNAGMRGEKRSLYEGGHRVPCFIRWPGGRLGKPRDIDTLTECQDLLPTLIDLCGLKGPKDARFDGVSLAAVLRDSHARLADRMLVVQYGGELKHGDAAVLWNKWRIVQGAELFDLKTDPTQQNNVAAAHADVVEKMRRHYDAWWKEIMPAGQEYIAIPVGTEHENPVQLSACDWAGVYCDNPGCYRDGANLSGPWHLRVVQPGTYTFALRRWPKESGLAIRAAAPALQGPLGGFPAGKALPIAKARIKIGDQEASAAVRRDDVVATFSMELLRGRTTLQTWFLDAQDKSVCGAYYVDVERK